MEKQPLITIVIPVYNLVAYLENCIESVIAQIYNNLEIILIDDCSTDGSIYICQKYKKNDKRIRIIKKEKNEGAGAARNAGIDVAKGSYIAFVETVEKSESGFLYCFQMMGLIPGIFLLISVVLFLDRMDKNYTVDKPVTDILILISGNFLVQLLFWNPGMHNIACYFYLLAAASFYREEQKQMESVGVKASDL